MGIFSKLFKTKKSTPAPDFKIKGDKVEVKVGNKVVTKAEESVKTESRYEPEVTASVDPINGYVQPNDSVPPKADTQPSDSVPSKNDVQPNDSVKTESKVESKPKTTAKKSTTGTKKTTSSKSSTSSKSKSSTTKKTTSSKSKTSTAKPKVAADK